MQENDNYEPPQSTLEKPDWPVLASRGSRFSGALIDTVILVIVMTPVISYFGYWEDIVEGTFAYGDAFKITLINALAFLVLNGSLIANYGQTIGKRIVGTRVVELESKKIMRFSDYVLRRYSPLVIVNLVPVLSFFGPLIDSLYIFNDDRRCIHDLIAGSIVIEA